MIRRLAASVALTVPVVGCAKPMVVSHGGERVAASFAGRSMLLLDPELVYEHAHTGLPVTPEPEEARRVAEQIRTSVEETASARGFSLRNEASLRVEQRAALERHVEALRDDGEAIWQPGRRREALVEHLGRLGEDVGADGLIFVALRVKAGKPGYGEPITGTLVAGTSTSHVQLSLLDLRRHEVAWANEVFVRSKPSSGMLDESMELLLSDFPARSGGDPR